jgi:transposase
MLYVGIDVGKQAHRVAILDHLGYSRVRPFTLENSNDGLLDLLQRVEAMNPDGEPVIFGLEATGHYWLPLYSGLARRGCRVAAINPLRVSAYRRLHIRPVKNDQRDAQCVAHVLRMEPHAQESLVDGPILEMRSLNRLREQLTEQMSDQKRRVIAVLDQLFPEFQQLFSDPLGKSARAVLEAYPAPADLRQADLDELTTLLKAHSRGQLGRTRAEALHQAACNSFGTHLAVEGLKFQLHILLQQIRFLESQIGQLDERLEALVAQLDQHLTSVPGIGPVLAAAILGELGHVGRFKNAAALVAYAGIDPRVFQSGQFEAGSTRMSKRGSSYLRSALWRAATVASWGNSPLGELYRQKKAQGKHHGTVIGMLMNKLVHIIYAVLRDRKPYVPIRPAIAA